MRAAAELSRVRPAAGRPALAAGGARELTPPTLTPPPPCARPGRHVEAIDICHKVLSETKKQYGREYPKIRTSVLEKARSALRLGSKDTPYVGWTKRAGASSPAACLPRLPLACSRASARAATCMR